VWSAIELFLWFAIYVGVGAIAVRFQPTAGPLLWYPPVAIGTGLLLRRGWAGVPVVLLGDLIVSHWQYASWPVAGVIAVCTLIECSLAAALMHRFGLHESTPREREMTMWLMACALAATLIASTIGSLVLARIAPPPPFGAFTGWITWWLGDAMSLVSLLPAFLLWPRGGPDVRLNTAQGRWPERALMFCSSCVVSALLFDQFTPLLAQGRGLLVLLGLMPIVWSAVRFDLLTTAVLIAWTSVVSAFLVHQGSLANAPTEAFSLLELQVYLAMLSLAGIALAGAIQRERVARLSTEAAAERMRLSEEHLRLAASAAQLASFEFRPDTDEVVWSKGMYELIGRVEGEDRPSRALWVSHMPAEQQEMGVARFARIAQTEGPFAFEQRMLPLGGGERIVSVRGEMIVIAGRRRVLGVVHDVTERANALAASAQLAAIVESTQDAIVSVSPEGTVLSWNDGAARMLGRTASEMIGHSKLKLVPETHRAECLDGLARVARGERIESRETIRLHGDGRELVVLEGLSPVCDADGHVVAIASILHDVSRQHSLEAQLRHSQKMEAIGRLAGGIAHDFNNMLTAIMGFTDIVDLSLPDDHPVRKDLGQIRHASERAAVLTRQLLTFSRRQPQSPEVLCLSEVARGFEPMLRRLIGDDVELVANYHPEGALVFVDPTQVESILMNLVVNARDAMPRGGHVRIETSIAELDASSAPAGQELAPGPFAMLSVADDGTGMDEATLAQIFEPFFTTKAKDKGTGLGLSTVYGIVRQNKGAIWAFSEKGRGTTFRIALPLHTESAKPATSPPVAAPASRGQETVIVVEDDAQVLEFIRVCLVSAGYIALTAAHPQDATNIARSHIGPADLLLTDVVMPTLSGADVARIARRFRPEIALAFMSGFDPRSFQDDQELPADSEFIAKPFSREILLRAVRRALDQQAQREVRSSSGEEPASA
jgi:PAS domain S-box-containing protein